MAMVKLILKGILVVGLLCGAIFSAGAQSKLAAKTEIRIQGRADVVVTEPSVKLGDIATIESALTGDDQAMIELRKIVIAQAPRAGESVTVQGISVLERLRDSGVQLQSLFYAFPREIKVTRAFREVHEDELQKALLAYLSENYKSVEVKHLVKEKTVKIPADSFGVKVVDVRPVAPGHYDVNFTSIAGSEPARFQMRALGDEWRLMPVAAKSLRKGDTIAAGDVRMNKVNGTLIGRDNLEQLGDIVGRTMMRDLGEGEMFNALAVAIPPVVTSGSRVTIVYKRGRLEATAMGVAVESGINGQEIKIRNEASKKIVTARVKQPGVVEVGGNIR
jgi:flagella basal body P-ring formation protein FlgA